MRIDRVSITPIYGNQNVNFNACANYGTPAILPEHLQVKLSEMRKNYFSIRSFFEQFKHKNLLLSSKIKKGYTDLIPKRQEALTFKYDDRSTFTVMCSRKKPQFIWINIDDGSPFNGIVIDNDKLVANYLKNNPHMLPHKIQYMNSVRMQAANPEKFIETAGQKVEQYYSYINKFQSGELRYPSQNQKHQKDIVNPYKEYWKFFTEEFNNQISAKLKNFRDIIK